MTSQHLWTFFYSGDLQGPLASCICNFHSSKIDTHYSNISMNYRLYGICIEQFSTFLKHLQPIIDYVYTGVKGNMFLKIVF